MPKFVLVRHGETTDNVDGILQGWRDSVLSEVGKEQATLVAPKLTFTPDIIFSSDMKRCQDTAKSIVESFAGARLFIDWRLRERFFGTLEGSTRTDTNWDDFFSADPTTRPASSEPTYAFHERLKAFIRDTAVFNSATILIVTHNGVINNFGYLFIDNYHHTRYDNSALVEYDISYDDPRLAPKPVLTWSPES